MIYGEFSIAMKVFLAQLTLGVVCLAGCSGDPESAATAANAAVSVPGRAASVPAVSVTTVPAVQQDFTVVLQAIGTAAPISKSR